MHVGVLGIFIWGLVCAYLCKPFAVSHFAHKVHLALTVVLLVLSSMH